MIKGFLFERFKGFDKTVLWLEQITTLIGSNASGKSNAVEGMLILSELASGRDLNTIFEGTSNTQSAIRGGAKGCCRFGAKSFLLGCIFDMDETHDLLYRITLGVNERVVVNSEELCIIKNGKTDAGNSNIVFKAVSDNSDSGDIIVEYANGKKGNNPPIRAVRSMSVLSQMQSKLPSDIINYESTIQKIQNVLNDLNKIFIIDPIPAMMRNYSRLVENVLKRNCSNVSSVLYSLFLKKDPLWPYFEEIVKSLPENEIKDINFVKTSLGDVILVQKEETGNSFLTVDAARLSDGTLRCIAALAAVLSEPMNSIVVIEELDNGIHPSRSIKLMTALTKISRQRHIDLVITTHNTTLLNGLSKEDILGVSVAYRDAKTKASRIVPFVDIKNQSGLLAMGGIGDALASEALLRAIKSTAEVKPFDF